MHHVVKVIRKVAVALVGVPVLIVGVILIPLPGPGLLVCLLGLLILSLEFDWARPYLEKTRSKIKKILDSAKAR